MARLPILIWPDPLLEQVSRPVQEDELPLLQGLIDNMWETVEAADGAGLSAIQVGEPIRLIVLRIDGKREVYVNPEIQVEGKPLKMREGCLSLPNVFEPVERYPAVTVRAFDEAGVQFTLQTDGLRAHALQHEVDHLDGRVFPDRLPKRQARKLKWYFKAIRNIAAAKGITPSRLVFGW